MGELLCSIEEKRTPSIDAQRNLQSLAICFAAVASAETGERSSQARYANCRPRACDPTYSVRGEFFRVFSRKDRNTDGAIARAFRPSRVPRSSRGIRLQHEFDCFAARHADLDAIFGGLRCTTDDLGFEQVFGFAEGVLGRTLGDGDGLAKFSWCYQVIIPHPTIPAFVRIEQYWPLCQRWLMPMAVPCSNLSSRCDVLGMASTVLTPT